MLVRQLTSSQLNDWMVYAAIEPFGEQREELRHGQKMAMTMNLKRNPKKKREPWKPAEFMNFVNELGPKPKKQTIKDMDKALGL